MVFSSMTFPSSSVAARTSNAWPRTASRSFSRKRSGTTSFMRTCIPGNIFVLLDDPQHPRYAAVDFGIVGSLDPRDQHYLAENFLAFFERDYRRIAELFIESGWIPSYVRVDELESAVRTVCEPIANKPLKEISFGHVLISLFEAAQRFDAQMQPQLMLIQKTLLQIEGVGRQLYPDLDLWKTAQPLLKQWMRERCSLQATLEEAREQLPISCDSCASFRTLMQNSDSARLR